MSALSSFVPGEPMIYERDGEIVYARYRDPPHNKIPRWVMSGHAHLQNDLFSYADFTEILEMSKTHPSVHELLSKLYTVYALSKNNKI
jgi:hypothetical protein